VNKRAILLLVVACASAATLRADVPLPPAPKHYVADNAGLLSLDDAQRLDQKLWRFDEETSNQVVVAIFPELTSPSLEDFTVHTAEAWRVGRKKLDNGVVLFVFVKDRKIRLEVGYGLEGALTDALSRRIIEETMAPAFRAGNYAQGIEAGVDAIIAATRGEYRREDKPQGGALILVVIGGLLILIFGFAALLPRIAPKATYDSTGWETLAGMSSLGYGPWRRRRRSGWGYWGGGSGGSSGGGSSWGGGFSGGGGSFGGGGASGGW
jgi:uncharacterized protein